MAEPGVSGTISVERVTSVTTELVRALQRLVPQLTDNHPPPSQDDLRGLLSGGNNTLLVARDQSQNRQIVGAGSLGTYRVPTGVRAVIEDVVVDQAHRGLGVGEALMRALLDVARESGAPGVSLTSNPGRQAANRLYQRLGFSVRRTNSYYYKFR